jgi:hypothetical protein
VRRHRVGRKARIAGTAVDFTEEREPAPFPSLLNFSNG